MNKTLLCQILAAAALFVIPLSPALAAGQWAVFETSFTSARKYDNSFLDVQVDVVFRSGDEQWLVPAFWAGGEKWTVRFAPPVQGDFTFQAKCSDPANQMVNGASQPLRVTAYTGDNPLRKHGFLRVSGDKRHFEHADGTPFLWLADTWWKNLCKRMTWEGFQELTADRKAKGFNAVQNNSIFDFDMAAIGHDGMKTVNDTAGLMKSCLEATPKRPVLCGEACYEGHMQTNWQDLQRYMFWRFMLSGAAGHTYGAAGVWQASVEGTPGIDPVYDWTTWKEGMNYPGSTQLGLGKKLLERYPWSRFEVHPGWAEGDCFAAGIPGEVRFIYQPKRNIYNWKGTLVKNFEPGVSYSAFYFDPASGRCFNQGTVEAPSGEYKAPRLPSPQDWVVVLEARLHP